MLEAAALSLTGGALGVLFGYLGSRAINTSFGWPTAIDMRSVVIGLTVSLGIGLFLAAILLGRPPGLIRSRAPP